MKHILVLYIAFIFFASCTSEDDFPNFHFEILTVDSVDIPVEFELGKIYPITVSYLSPTPCHAFREFYYVKENNERTVAPITYVFEESDCETLEDSLLEATFNFKVTSNGSYIFNFWQGKDEAGEDQYLSIEVPVVE